jgi:5-carboxyvanillate decarboxylase
MKKIDIEAHFFTKEYEEAMLRRKGFPKLEMGEEEGHQRFVKWMFRADLWAQNPFSLHQRLLDLGENRLREMDENGIDAQVLSLPAIGCEQLEVEEATILTRKINDELSGVIRKHPDRFIGLAEIAPQDPERAADELERAVKELGFKGAKVNSNIRGEYLDQKKYWPIFERAQRLDVPISLHPSIPSPRMVEPYADYGFMLAGPTLGFIAETSLHAVRLILGGVFDEYPGLKIILGHMGEALPFWLSRIDILWQSQGLQSGLRPKMTRRPSDYVKDNFILTISGVFFQPAFLCAYLALGADRIGFAVDAPFESYKKAVDFMDSLSICDSDKEKIYHLNAERLFKIR